MLSGDDDLLFVNKLVDLLSSKAGKGGNVQLTIDRAAQDAAFEGLERAARRRAGLGGRASSRAPARSWRWPRCRPSTPTSSPPTTSPRCTTTTTRLNGRRGRAAAQPGDPDDAAARLDVQARHRRRRDRERRLRRRRRRAGRRRPTSSRRPPASSGLIDNEGRSLRHRQDPVRAGAWRNSCNTTFAQLGVAARRARSCASRPRRSASTSSYLEDLGPQAVSNFPDDANRAAGRAVRPSASSRCGPRPLQMAMVAAGHRQPGHGDEALPRRRDPVPRPRDAAADRARGARPRPSPPRRADQLTDLMVDTVDEGTAVPGRDHRGRRSPARPAPRRAASRRAAVRLVRLVRPGPGPRGRGRGDDPEGRRHRRAARSPAALLGGPIAKAIMEAVIE